MSQMAQQQALRDFAQSMAAFFDPDNPARRPSWRKAGRDEGFRVVAVKPGHVRPLSRKTGEAWVPKAGWLRFRWSRAVPPGAKSYRVTMDRAGRWHLAFAVIPDPVPAPGNGHLVGVDRGVAVSAALSSGDLLHAPGLTGRNVRAKSRLNRGILRSGWGLLVRRHADVNAAMNIAAGHAVTARGGFRDAGPVNREPQLVASLTGRWQLESLPSGREDAKA